MAWKMAQSTLCSKLFIAPGNAGTADCGENLPIAVTDFPAIRSACLELSIGLLVPGSEVPLVKGIVDFFREDPALSGMRVIGPARSGARMEGSKTFAKQFMQRHGIPTAGYREFDSGSFSEGETYIRSHSLPVVLKADGLAAGKGVLICQTHEEALGEFGQMIRQGKFGKAGRKVVVEEFLEGIELSVFVLSDGRSWLVLPEAKDYKRIGENDTGPNTGGMGAVSPVPFASELFMEKVRNRIIKPTMNGLANDHIHYRGFLFFGLINVGDEPFVIEYNCRLGDPETQVVLPRLKNDLVELLQAAGEGSLGKFRIETEERIAATTILASAGYPGSYEKGKPIGGIPKNNPSRILFHAGTARKQGILVTDGGRVLAATALGADMREAVKSSGALAEKIDFEGKYFRGDIGREFV